MVMIAYTYSLRFSYGVNDERVLPFDLKLLEIFNKVLVFIDCHLKCFYRHPSHIGDSGIRELNSS